MLTVFEIAPERKGWTAPIIRRCPSAEIKRVPETDLNAQSKTARCSSCSADAPSTVPVDSRYLRIAVRLSSS
jgi:hypothetical protein